MICWSWLRVMPVKAGSESSWAMLVRAGSASVRRNCRRADALVKRSVVGAMMCPWSSRSGWVSLMAWPSEVAAISRSSESTVIEQTCRW